MRAKEIAWLRAAVEGVVIVGSILLAFALDAWWDERARRLELLEQVDVLAGEMESTRAALERVRGAHAANADLAAHLAMVLNGVDRGAEVVVSDTLLGPLLPQVTADVTTGSLDAFLAAGGLELIDDAEVQSYLLGWSAQVEDLLDDEIYLRNFVAADLARHLRATSDVARAERLSIPLVRGMFGADPPVAAELLGTVTLRREQELINLLAARETGERGMRSELEDMLERVDRIVGALNELR